MGDQTAKSEEKVTLVEVILLAVLLGACLLLFRQQDIMHTAVSSTAILKGHLLDFYSYNSSLGIPDSYLPSTYILYAIWSIPPYLLGMLKTTNLEVPIGLYCYMKLLPVTAYVLAGFVVNRIGETLGLEKRLARILAYVTMTLPVALYSQFIFCQYDIFTTLFVLLGIDAYLRNKTVRFVLFFGLAATFKYFSLAIFVPLLLLRQKNILKIMLESLLMAVPFALEVLLFLHDPEFVYYVLNFKALGYLFQGLGLAASDSMTIAMATPALQFLSVICMGSVKLLLHKIMDFPIQFVIAFGICVAAYVIRPKDTLQYFHWMNFLCALMMFAVFGFMFWHPQWLMLILPFFGMSLIFSKKPWLLMLLDVVLMAVFVAYVSNQWFRELDQGLLSKGILASWIDGQIGAEFMIKDFYLFHNVKLLKVGVSFMLCLLAILRYPAFMVSDVRNLVARQLVFARIRLYAGLACFLLPCGISLFFALTAPYCTFNGENFAGHLPGITTTSWLSQVFTVETDDADYMEFYVYDYDRANTGTLEVSIKDLETETILLVREYDVSQFPNRGWIRLDLRQANLKAGGHYLVNFISYDATEENSVTLYHTGCESENPNYYGLFDGNLLGSDLCIKIFEGSRTADNRFKNVDN